jgi:hypothetical protein
VEDLLLPLDDVVDHVRVHRHAHVGLAPLDLLQELDQPAHVVALREPLAVHDPALLEHPVGAEEPVRGDEVDARVVRPTGEERLQDPRGGALADGDAPPEADHERHGPRGTAEEVVRGAVQRLGGRDPEVQQPRQRQVDVGDLVEVEPVVERPHPLDLVGLEGHRRRGPEPGPRGPVERAVARPRLVGHGRAP